MTEPDPMPGFVDEASVVAAARDAAEAVVSRSISLEAYSGAVTMVFVSHVEAHEILAAVRARPDSAVKRVVEEMYEQIVAGDDRILFDAEEEEGGND